MKEHNNIEKFYKDLINQSGQDPLLWDKIAERLSKNELFDKYNQLLENSNNTPPASLWDTIESGIENSSVETQYKEKILTNAPLPPESLWNAIESDIENSSIEAQYKEKILANAPLPPESLWNSINGSLSSYSTWERILVSLNKRDKNIKWLQASLNLMTTTLALLMLFYSVIDLPYARKLKPQNGNLETLRKSNAKGVISNADDSSISETSFSPEENNEVIPEENNETIKAQQPSNTIINYQKNNSLGTLPSQQNKKVTISQNKSIDADNNSTKSNDIDHGTDNKSISSESYPITEINNEPGSTLSKFLELEKTQSLIAKNVNNTITDSIRTQFPEYYEKPKGTFFASFYINNPWINSSRTIQNFTNKTLNYNQLYLTFGAGIGYEKYFNKFNLSSSLNYNRLGQKYVSYQEGVTVNNHISLNYLTLRMSIRPNNKPFYGGIYYGVLMEELYELVNQSYEVDFDENPEIDHYFKNDFGITMGLEHTIPVFNRPIKFNASLSHSVFSLYTGNMYHGFNKSYNLYLSLGFRYCFK